MKFGFKFWGVLSAFVLGSFALQGAEQMQQFANKAPTAWQNGNLNSINSLYVEGSCVPFRYEINGIPANGEVQLEIHYDFTKGGVYAFDYQTDYRLTEGGLLASNGGLFANGPLTTITTNQINYTGLAIPDDPSIHTDNLMKTNKGTQYFAIAGFYTNAYVLVPPTFGGSSNTLGDSDKYMTIAIQGITNGQIAVAWAGHVAVGGAGNWPQGKGAGSISGSPFHQNGGGLIVGGGSLSTANRSMSAGTVTPSADLELTKTASTNLAHVGDTVTYRVTCTNVGPSDATGVAVRDLVPAGMTYVTNSAGSAYVPLTGTWTIGALPAGSFTSIVITALVASPGVITNLAQVSASGTSDPDSTPNNNFSGTPPVVRLPLEDDEGLAVVTALPVADLALSKRVSVPYVLPGSNFTFTLTVTNSGPNPATGVTVQDVLPAGLTFVSGGAPYNSTSGIWTVGTLAAGASSSLTLTVKAVAAGVYTNAAEVWTANERDRDSTPGNGATNEDDYARVSLTAVSPGLTVVKTAGAAADGVNLYVVSATPVVYAYQVINSGDTYLTNVVVTDDKLGAVGTFPGPLAPGGSVTLYATNVAALASVTNIGTASATPSQANGVPLGVGGVSDTDAAVVLLVRPEIHMHKAATAPESGPVHQPDGFVHYTSYGSNVMYVYHMHNYGDTALTNLTVTDDKLGFIGVVPFLPVGGTAYLFATNFNFTNFVINVGTATATPAFGDGTPIPGIAPVVHTDTAVADVASPGVRVIKTAGNARDSEVLFVLPGSNVVYKYEIVVTGDTALTNVVVTDDKLGLVGVLPGPLAPGSTNYLYATNLNVTAAVTNVATVTGYPTNGLPAVMDDHPAVVRVVRPGVSIVKTAGLAPDGGIHYILPGSPVLYTYKVVNTGDTYLTNAVVTDDVLGLVGVIPGPIAPGATNILVKTAASVTGSVVNVGTVVAGPSDSNADALPGIGNVTANDNAAVQVVNPGVSIVKTAGTAVDGGAYPILSGASVLYTYTVVNTGDTYLTNVVVTDDVLGPVGVIAGPVAPGATNVLQKTHVNVTASVTNVATASGLASQAGGAVLAGLPAVTDTDDAAALVVAPALTLVKTAGGTADGANHYVVAGTPVVYAYQVINSGDTYLANVAVTDDKLGAVGVIPGPLAPGGSVTLYATNVGVLASVTNIGTASGTPSLANGVSLGVGGVSDTDAAVVLLVRPEIHMHKAATAPESGPMHQPDGFVHYTSYGSNVMYVYHMHNYGDTALTNVTVTDDKLGAIGVVPFLPVGGTAYLFATNFNFTNYVLNVGTATGTPAFGDGTPIPGIAPVVHTDTAVADVAFPGVQVIKTAGNAKDGDPLYALPGSNVVYTYAVIVTGDTGLTNVTVVDDVLGPVGVLPGPLAPGSTNYLYATNLNVTADVTNHVLVTGYPTNGLPPVTDGSLAFVNVVSPGVRIVKTAGSAPDGGTNYILAGASVTYTYAVINTGDTYLTNLVVTDDQLGLVGVLPGPVAPGSTNTLVKTATNVTGSVLNVGTVVAGPSDANGDKLPGIPDVTGSDMAFVQVVGPAVSIVKTAGGTADGGVLYVLPGSPAVYTYRIVNTGNTFLTNLVVTDDKLGLIGVIPGPVAPGATNTLTATNASVLASVTNIGTVVAAPSQPDGTLLPGIAPVTASDSAIARVARPGLSLVKTANAAADGLPAFVTSGAAVVYAYRIVNTGDTWLASIAVTDDKLGPIGVIPGPVAPGATNVLLATNLNVTAAVTNIGTASGLPVLADGTPLGLAPVQASDSAVALLVGPGLAVVKTAGNAADGGILYVTPNTPVVYTYRVVNTGDTYLVNVAVTDDKLGAVGTVPGPLAPGASQLLFKTNVGVTASVTNVATATGTPSAASGVPLPGLQAQQDTDDAVVQVLRPEIHMHKAATAPESGPVHQPDGFVHYTSPGSNVMYVYHVHNQGDTALTNITMNDDKLGYIGVIPFLATNQTAYLFATNFNFTNYTINIGTVTGTPAFASGAPIPGLAPVVHSDTAVADVSSPGVRVIKTAGGAKDGEVLYVLPGSNVVYKYEITVTGDAALTNVIVTDDKLGLVGVLQGPLLPGTTNYLYATNLNVTADVVNTTLVTGYPTNGLPPVTDGHQAAVKVVSPGLSIVKTADATPDGGTRYVLSGASVTYTYTVVNTGDTYLTNIVVTDDKLGAIGVIVGPLAPGATGVLSMAATVNGSVVNVGTAVGGPSDANGDKLPGIPDVTDSDDATVEVVNPEFSLVKRVLVPAERMILVGEQATFRISVFNSGDVTLTSVPVTDAYDTNDLAFVSAVPAADDPANDGVLNWADVGPLAPGAETNIDVTFLAIGSTAGRQGTNVVVSAPSTPPGRPPVPPQTNDVPYDIRRPGYSLVKSLTSPSGRAAQVGEPVVFTVTLTNTGDVALVTLPVEDRYETQSLAFVAAVPATDDAADDGILNWTDAGPLAPGASTSLVVTFAAVSSSAGQVMTNVVVASPGTPQGEPGVPVQTNTAAYRVSVAGFSLAKTVESPSGRRAQVGETVVFNLAIVNTGDVTLVTVPVEDQYAPAVLSFTGALPASDDGLDDGLLNWGNVGPLAPGQGTNILVSFTALASTAGELATNTVIAAPTTPPGEPPVPPRTNSVLYGVNRPDYSLVKVLASPTNRPPVVGETLVFTLTVVNTGDVAMASLPVRDEYETNDLAFVSALPAPDAQAPGVLTWTDVGPLAAGASTSITVTFSAVNGTEGERKNRVIASPQPPEDYPPFRTLTNDAPYTIDLPGFIGDRVWEDLDLDGLQDEGEPGVAGVGVRLYDAASNLVDSTSTDGDGLYGFANRVPQSYFLEFDLPSGFAFTLAGQGFSSGLDSDADPATGRTATEPLAAGENDPNWDAGLVRLEPAIGVVKTAGTAADGEIFFLRPGQDCVYTFLVTNSGTTFLTNIVVEDDVLGPVGVIAGPVAPGWSGVLTLTHSNVLADVVNVATARGTPVFANGEAVPGLQDVSGSDSAEARIVYFTLTKEDTPDPVRPGQGLTYTLWLANPSPNTVTGLVVTESYPAGFTFLSAAPAPDGGNNVWTIGDLAPGALLPIVINGTVSAGFAGGSRLTNRVVAVSGNGGGAQDDEVTLVETTPPAGRTSLRVTKRDDADPVGPGDPLVYTIRVENQGLVTATNVTVTETYDPLFTFVSASPAPKAGTSNVWALGNLPVKSFVEITVTGVVSPSATNGAVLLDSVVAKAKNAGPSGDEELTLVGTTPPPQIGKVANFDPIKAGTLLTYTITVANVSQAIISNVTVVETYDPKFAFSNSVPATMAGTVNAWDLGDLPPGYVTNIVIQGLVSRNAQEEDVLFNTAEVFSRSGSRTVHLVTRVINPKVIPVTLLYFKAVDVPGRVKLKWATGTEFENLGFNLYRSASKTGFRTRLNAELVPGSVTSDGQAYRFYDETARPGATYYYWLEELGWNFKSKVHGPAVRAGTGSGGDARPLGVLATFKTSATGGLYRIRSEALAAAGLPVKTLDPKALAVRVGGRVVPVFVSGQEAVLGPEDYLLFYAPASPNGLACQVTVDEPVAVMSLAPAAPSHAPGDVFAGRAGRDQRIVFKTDPAVVRYFLHGFAEAPVWVVDVTEPTNAIMLYGYAYATPTNGLTAVYLSYDTPAPARCLAVQDAKVMDVGVTAVPAR